MFNFDIIAGYEVSLDEKWTLDINGLYELDDFSDPTASWVLGAALSREFDNGWILSLEAVYKDGEAVGTEEEASVRVGLLFEF